METQERGRLMEKDGGAKGAAGSGQTLEGCLPAAWHRGPLPVGHPCKEGSATHTCSGGQVWRPARRDAARAQSPVSGSPGLAVVPTPSPSLESADSNPPLAPSCSPRRRAGSPGGRGPDEGGEGARPMSLSHSPPADARMLSRAGTVCSACSPSARPGSLPAFLPRALRPQALPRPAPHPHSRSQVTSRPHLPACQNRSPPEPDPSHSRHTASSLRFRNSGVQNSGRLDTSERGHPPVGRGSEEDKDHTCEGHCVCGGRVSPHQSPLHP